MPDYDATQDMPPDMPIPEAKPVEKPRGRIGMTFGGYEVTGELGRGGMGVVYRARQKTLNREVALKMLTGHYGKDELQRFLAEAQTSAALHHSHIVQIYEVGEIDGSPFFSMEFIEGGTLTEKLRRGLLPPRETAELLMSVARALHFAHQHGVVHRDMKPHNILIDPAGVPKVADFGIAKRMNDDSELTRSGAVIGTPTYMAPEQAKGTSRDVGPGADIYSLGAILYEMLTGRPPFLPEESDTALTIRILTEETPSPAWYRPETPRELEVICLKCLQKDPRDRYGSAAAFAEDLRRYLDDEEILARPPSKIGKAIKWTRRHPWKFVGSAALVLLVAFGTHRFYRWEWYERPHLEYAATLDYVNGALEPALRVKAAQATERAVTLKLTRRGRSGPITKIEVRNPRGHPASTRRLMLEEPVPLYIESLTGLQPNAEKTPESSTVEQLFDGQAIREIIGRDRDGSVNWRILYDRVIQSAGSAPVIRARFVNLRGLEAGSRKGASIMEFERDKAGRDTRVSFYNSGGKPAANGEGVYAYQLDRDAQERVSRLTNLDRNGKPAPNRAGLTGCELKLDTANRLARIEMRDEVGQLALWNGVAALVTEYDAAGNAIRVRRLDMHDQPMRGGADDWAVQEIPRDARGEIVARKFFRAEEGGALNLVFERRFAYDENGHLTELRVFGSEKSGLTMRHDVDGNLVEEKVLDAEGNIMIGDRGFAIRRVAYQFSPQGLRTEEGYFDVNGQPIYCTSGHRRFINEYDATGALRRQAMEDHDPKRFAFYRFLSLTDYDLQSRLQQSTIRYEDQEGQLVDAEKAGLPYNMQEEEYDENGRESVTWQYGWSLKIFGATVWRKDSEWYTNGGLRLRIWQAYDEKKQKLETIQNRDPAHTEEEFDGVGKYLRKLESAFDEKRLGFYSRELRFVAGELQHVVFRSAEGTELKDIRVIIHAIEDGAQPKSAELKVGDQLLTSNGTPMGSAYEWMLDRNFAGGYIEVLRDGQKLRIDGFEPGKLGVILEDRGPGVP
ncbi:MAG TPA: serine/threonine-protein kinase [Chthoniobacter sp.]|nr:serine/threonine-protein kinase [Chthoniobacter sp.]